MTINLNKQAAKQHGITIDEALLMLVLYNKADLNKAETTLIEKGFITAERDSLLKPIGWRLTNKGNEVIDAVILDSDKHQESQEELTVLATTLKALFPKGKKVGTNYYWADGVALISRRLKLFFKKYGNTYNDKQIIQATEKYIQGFNGNYQYMRLLKYFIFKEKIGANGEIEGDSELISYIENAGQEESLSNDWTIELK